MSITIKRFMTCDKCEKKLPFDYPAKRTDSRFDEWTHVGWRKDYCPHCSIIDIVGEENHRNFQNKSTQDRG